MRIRLNSFAGMFPKVHPTRLQENASQLAQDITLGAGVITPLSQTQTVLSGLSAGICQVWAYDIDRLGDYPWQMFNEPVSIARSPVFDEAKRRYFWSRNNAGGLMQTWFAYSVTVSNTSLAPAWSLFNPNTGQWDTSSGSGSNATTTIQTYPAKNYKVGVPAPTNKPLGKCYVMIEWQGTLTVENADFSKFSMVNTTSTGGIAIGNYVPDGDTPEEARSYVFTYVNEIGEESAPSPPSNVIFAPLVDNTAFNSVNNKKLPPQIPMVELFIPQTEYAIIASEGYVPISKIRIYRTNVASNGNAEYQFVTEIGVTQNDTVIAGTQAQPVGTILFNDKIASSFLAETLPSQGWLPPSKALKSFGVSNDGFGYGFDAQYNTVCFSEPYHLYAWQADYEISTRYPIVAMGHYDNVIVIATTGELMLAIGNSPEALTVITPEVGSGCVSMTSLVSTGVSCIYASDDGLMLVSGQSVQNITGNIFDRKQWQALNPKSIHGYFYQGLYIFFYDNGLSKAGYVLDLANLSQGVTQIEQWCVSGYVDHKHNELYLLMGGGWGNSLVKFNPNTIGGFIEGTWQSKKFNMDTPKRMLAGQVIADSYNNVKLTVVGDGKLIGQYKVKNSQPFRIHNHSVKRDFVITVTTSDVVREVAIGETMRDMLE